MSFNFKCPVCGGLQSDGDKTLRCENNHCFDKAKQGYVNLLQSQKSSKKRHGDDTLMVKARTQFLEQGYYFCLLEGIVEAIKPFVKPQLTLADLGCGECWYTKGIYDYLTGEGSAVEICGIDISKQALISASKRCPDFHLAVASTSDLPLADNSCDIVVSVFAPCSENEIRRVLKSDGVWIKAMPLERHLMGLKSVIYEKPYENTVNRNVPEGFELNNYREIRANITVTGEDTENLFKMTPYYYKTSEEDQKKIKEMQSLCTEIEFGICTYTTTSL